MNRPIIITSGIVIILLIVGLWVYLLVFGAPKNATEVFSTLGIQTNGTESVRVIDTATLADGEAKLSLTDGALQLLTTRAVAGFAFASSSENIVRYVERGTGHVYEINIDSGVETQISLTTLPQTITAVFSLDATKIAFTTYANYESNTSVGSLATDGGNIELVPLPHNVQNIAFKDEEHVYFTFEGNGRTTGYVYDLDTKTQSEVFTIDATDIQTHWGANLANMYIQTKPTKYLEGYLYSVTKKMLVPATPSKYGLTSFMNNEYVITSYVFEKKYISEALNNNGQWVRQAMLMIPEKCVFDVTVHNYTWCAGPPDVTDENYLEQWYKGAITSKDLLWGTDLTSQSSTLVGDLSSLAGRDIDVTGLTQNNRGSLLLFANKIDQSLWIYRTQ